MKKLVLAVVLALGLCAFAAMPASAVSETREAEIAYRSIKIVLDGREICPRDAAGNEVEPFILDGTTYLPVRAVADALGLDVHWRENDSTVLLTGYEDEHGFFSVTVIDLPPELPRRAESAAGHNAVESVTLAYRDIRLLVDGVVIQPKDAAGNTVEPFILGGTTYLPVRAVADALGLAVDWDAATGTVRLSHWLETCSARYAVLDGQEPELVEELKHEYDEFGRPTLNTFKTPSVYGEERPSYDGDGRIARIETVRYDEGSRNVTAAGTTVIGYDNVSGRCVLVEISGSGTDGADYSSETRYEYDESGRLVRAAWGRGKTVWYWAEWEYDELGRVSEFRENNPDYMEALGLPFRENDTVRKFSYDEDGRLTQVDEGGILPVYLTYDEDGRELSYTRFDGDLLARWDTVSGYDENGRLFRQEMWANEKLSYAVDYSYDGHGRLIRKETVPEGDKNESLRCLETCTYDESGNLIRLEMTGAAGTAVFTWEYVKAGG